MEIENEVFYSELPSRNVYIDSVVNALPGYYPARSEFTVEYNNEVEQDLTNVCFLYDQVVNNGGKLDKDDEENPLENLLSLVKKEPDENMWEEGQQSDTNLIETSSSEDVSGPSRKRKGKNQTVESSPSSCSTERIKIKLEDDGKWDTIKMEPISEEEEPSSNKVTENLVKAEEELSRRENPCVSQEDANILEQLCLATIDIYNNRLRERNERKEFVRNHGFLDQKKIYSWYNIHNLELGDGLFNVFLKKFIKLFDSAYEFDKFIQQLKLEKECRIKLNYLDELRANGIRHKKIIPLYNKLKENRNKLHEEIKHIDISDIVSLSSLSASETSEISKSDIPKRASRKLEISHLPNYKSLTEAEKDLCSTIRLTPESYLNFKEIMIAECKKLGGLRLAQARPLIKIDVNKTRRVYDHLIAHKLIWREK